MRDVLQGDQRPRRGDLAGRPDRGDVGLGAACIAEPAYDIAQIQELVPTIERDGRRLWGLDEALTYYRDRTGIEVTSERVEYYRRFYALPMFLFTHNAARQVHLNGNRLARFAWTSTEMLYQAELRFAAPGGFRPRAVTA